MSRDALDLIRARQAELCERFAARVELIESGEATHFELDPLIREAEFLLALAAAHFASARRCAVCPKGSLWSLLIAASPAKSGGRA